MAKIFAQITGGEVKQLEASTVAEVKRLMDAANYTAVVNEEPSTDDQKLNERDYVALTVNTKGAC